MNQQQIKTFIQRHEPQKARTIVIVDFSNVERWKDSLGWTIDIRNLANLVKNFSQGKKYLRRFYYGSDFGPKEKDVELLAWSAAMLQKARMNGFEVVTKRVKYMPSKTNPHGYDVKCDLDVEMALDLIRERDNYDTIVLFSGDGDLACVVDYLHQEFNKECYVFGARDHVGREIVDALKKGVVKGICFAEDFEYRLKGRDIR